MALKEEIVTAIMSLVRQQPKKMERPTIDELERIINSESTDAVNIEPDGSVTVTPQATTVGTVADLVVLPVERDIKAAKAVSDDLAMILRRMMRQADMQPGDTSLKVLSGKAKQLLAKHGLEGSLLRDDA